MGLSYYWRVNATNTSGISQWSITGSFTTVQAPPETPVLLSPANGVTKVTANQTFSWNAAARASYYAIQISTLSSFSPLIINDSNITGTTFNTQILSSGTQYYWRVKAINNGGSSSWTTPWNFTTIYASPSVPVLVSPVDGATRIPVSTVLRWNKTANATVYQLQLSKTNDFSSTEIDSIGLASTSLALNSLNQETVYYWRVRGKNADSTLVAGLQSVVLLH